MVTRIAFTYPESRVYHLDPQCSALNRANRYWPVHRGVVNERGEMISDEGRVYDKRRPCGLCARGVNLAMPEELTRALSAAGLRSDDVDEWGQDGPGRYSVRFKPDAQEIDISISVALDPSDQR